MNDASTWFSALPQPERKRLLGLMHDMRSLYDDRWPPETIGVQEEVTARKNWSMLVGHLEEEHDAAKPSARNPMNSYSLKIFSGADAQYLKHATALIDRLPSSYLAENLFEKKLHVVRCHELARAVGRMFGLMVIDGKYGAVDHSWLMPGPHILDVYAVGRLPQVQLVSIETLLPHGMYRIGPTREDIDTAFVQEIVDFWTKDDEG